MNFKDSDTGIILVLIERFERQRLPWLIDIQLKLDQGSLLNDIDIEYLSEALHDARLLLPYLDRHPEYEPFFAKVMHYYKSIADQALVNESFGK